MASTLTYTPIEQIENARRELGAGFASGKLKSIAYRKYQILQLAYAVKDHTSRWEAALNHDLGRPTLESSFLEIGGVLTEIMEAYDNVEKWTKTEKVPFNLMWFAVKPMIRKEAKGVVLVIGPFNYPIFCVLGPLVAAIAAGNTVMIKPSEQAEATAALMTELLGKYMDNDIVRVVNGSIPETTKILELQFDHIMFTGGSRVAQIVATAAAKHLTPCTLELGGKSPVIVDPSCDLYSTVRRTLFAKFANAGQTCVASDYVLVPREFLDEFVEMVHKVYAEFYPPETPASPTACAHMITTAAYDRVLSLVTRTSGQVIIGGSKHADPLTKFIPPTVVVNVSPEDPLMQEEIFGPVLPIVVIDKLEDSIAFVNARPHPLALYVFTRDNSFKEKVFANTQSGAAVANECLIHAGAAGVPFGGTGASGYGSNTGKAAFDSFTHFRGTIDSPTWLDKLLYFRFPPYTDSKVNFAKKQFYKKLPTRPSGPPLKEASSSGLNNKYVLFFMGMILLAATTGKGRGEMLNVWARMTGVMRRMISN